ncbi:hypothetical protein [Arthronema virus TR020]|uniref:Uncharacterized protein n=1 Tax=Arthronema virus TR020 TaxID=2736280 RepID=A0A7G3WH11_9CAUD|nr:hypothetical protein [Arthronema virus TR020]
MITTFLNRFIVKLKSGTLMAYNSYELTEQGFYLLDGWMKLPMDKVDSITLVNVEILQQYVGEHPHVVAVTFTYEGTSYVASTRGNYVRQGERWVKILVMPKTAAMRQLLHDIYTNALDFVYQEQ